MRTLFILLFIALAAAYGQTLTSVAVLPSDRTDSTVLNNDELEVLTDKMRQAALKVLPSESFVLVKQDVVVRRLGGAEKYIKVCTESSCIVDLGKLAQVDYVSQASVGKLGDKIRLKVELYNVRTEGLVGMLSDEESENVKDLLAIVEKRVPARVFGKIPGSSVSSKVVSPSIGGDNGKSGNASFWVALGLDLAGAALVYAGYMKDRDMAKSLDKYNVDWQTEDYYDDAWKKAKDSRSSRNMFYVIGGLVLATAIGVHIWF